VYVKIVLDREVQYQTYSAYGFILYVYILGIYEALDNIYANMTRSVVGDAYIIIRRISYCFRCGVSADPSTLKSDRGCGLARLYNNNITRCTVIIPRTVQQSAVCWRLYGYEVCVCVCVSAYVRE